MKPTKRRESLFKIAVNELGAEKQWRDPESFQQYLSKNRLSKDGTAANISVQTLEDLDPFLRENSIMVLRLGSTLGTGATSQFGLIRAKHGIEDFFLVDKNIYESHSVSDFHVEMNAHELLPFFLFRHFTERSVVNLALASGLLGKALNIDPPHPKLSHGGGSSIYSFSVRPRDDLDLIWEHRQGQVEIDCIIAGKRNGAPCIFVIEAKHGNSKSLSKAKLVYAAAALGGQNVAPNIEIIPVYLNSKISNGYIEYNIAECRIEDPRTSIVAIDSLVVTRVSRQRIKLPTIETINS